MLMPKRVKYRKVHRGRMKGVASRGNKLTNGDFGLVALEPGWITAQQIEAARMKISRYTRKGGKMWIKIFPDKPVTEKPAETRMGSGKGSPEYWVSVVKPGRIMFEVKGISEVDAREAMRLAGHNLPIKCKFVMKDGFTAEDAEKAVAEAMAKVTDNSDSIGNESDAQDAVLESKTTEEVGGGDES